MIYDFEKQQDLLADVPVGRGSRFLGRGVVEWHLVALCVVAAGRLGCAALFARYVSYGLSLSHYCSYFCLPVTTGLHSPLFYLCAVSFCVLKIKQRQTRLSHRPIRPGVLFFFMDQK